MAETTVEKRDAEFHTALSRAVMDGNVDEAKSLLEQGAPGDGSYGEFGEHKNIGKSLMVLAVDSNKPDMVGLLKNHDRELITTDSKDTQNARYDNGLMHAVRSDKPQMLAAMLEGYTPQDKFMLLQTVDGRGDSPLHLAKSPETVRVLLDDLTPGQQQKLIQLQNDGKQTPLERASPEARAGIDEYRGLKEHHAKQPIGGATPLSDAAGRNDVETINKIRDELNHESWLELLKTPDNLGRTPLHAAAFAEGAAAISALMKGLTPEERNTLRNRQDTQGEIPAAVLDSNIKRTDIETRCAVYALEILNSDKDVSIDLNDARVRRLGKPLSPSTPIKTEEIAEQKTPEKVKPATPVNGTQVVAIAPDAPAAQNQAPNQFFGNGNPDRVQAAGRQLAAMNTEGNDRVVSRAEFEKSMKSNSEEVLAALDINQDGRLSKSELRAAIEASGLNSNDARIGGIDNAVRNLGAMLARGGVVLDDTAPKVVSAPVSLPGATKDAGVTR